MARADEYRKNAAELLRMSLRSTSPSEKATLLEMAQKLIQLAEKENGAESKRTTKKEP